MKNNVEWEEWKRNTGAKKMKKKMGKKILQILLKELSWPVTKEVNSALYNRPMMKKNHTVQHFVTR